MVEPCFVLIFYVQIAARAHKLSDILLKLFKNSACVRKRYFLLKKLSARFQPPESLSTQSPDKSTTQVFSLF